MTIVVFGLENGLLTATEGFRKEFSTAREAELYIQLQCSKVQPHKVDSYSIYIGDETTSISKIIHLNNWDKADTKYKEEDYKVKKVDILAIKKEYDLNYRLELDRKKKMQYDTKRRLNNMSNAEYEQTKKDFNDMMGN